MITKIKELQHKYNNIIKWLKPKLIEDGFEVVSTEEYFGKEPNKYKHITDESFIYKISNIDRCFLDEVYVILLPEEYLIIVTGSKYLDIDKGEQGGKNILYIGELNYLYTFTTLGKCYEANVSIIPFIQYFVENNIIYKIMHASVRSVSHAINNNRQFLEISPV